MILACFVNQGTGTPVAISHADSENDASLPN